MAQTAELSIQTLNSNYIINKNLLHLNRMALFKISGTHDIHSIKSSE